MRDILKYSLGAIIGLTLFSIVSFIFVLIVVSISTGGSDTGIKPNSVLSLNFSKGIVDRASEPGFDIDVLQGSSVKPVALNSLLELLDFAKSDDKIKGVLMNMNNFINHKTNILPYLETILLLVHKI